MSRFLTIVLSASFLTVAAHADPTGDDPGAAAKAKQATDARQQSREAAGVDGADGPDEATEATEETPADAPAADDPATDGAAQSGEDAAAKAKQANEERAAKKAAEKAAAAGEEATDEAAGEAAGKSADDKSADDSAKKAEGEEGEEGEEEAALKVSPGGKVDLAFSANLDKLGTACHRDEPAGCAIHTAVLDLDGKTISGVKLLDRHKEMGTWFPTWYPTGSHVIFEQVQWAGGQTNVLVATKVSDSSRSLLVEKGRFPSVNTDGSRLVWSLPTSAGGILIADVKIGDKGGMAINNAKNFSDDRVSGSHHGEDAQFVPGSDAVVFHQKGDNTKSGVIGIKDGNPKFPSEKLQGCGHTAVSPDGSAFICGLSSGEGTYMAKRTPDGGWSEMDRIFPALTQADYASASTLYAGDQCDRILMSYPEFCATSDRLIASGQCATTDASGAAKINFSRLLLIEFDPSDNETTAELTDLSALIESSESLANGKSQAVTAACLSKSK